MLKQGVFTAKTVEEAKAEGLAALGLTEAQASVEVLEEGKRGGFFGFGAVKACVRITEKQSAKAEAESVEETPVPQETVTETEEKAALTEETEAEDDATEADETDDADEAEETEETDETNETDGERAVAFLTGLLEKLELDLTATLVAEGEKIEIELASEDEQKEKEIVGKKGELLDSIQTLAGAVANIGRTEYKRVVVDCGNYRENREEMLVKIANRCAEKAVRLGRKIMMEPMPPYERRIIHAALAENEKVTTKSEGKDPNRSIVIEPEGCDPDSEPLKEARGGKRYANNRKNYNKGGYKGGKPYNRTRKPYGYEGKPYERRAYDERKPYNEGKTYERRTYDERKPYNEGKPYERRAYDERKPYNEGKTYERRTYDERKPYNEGKPYERRTYDERKPYNEGKPYERKPYDGERKPYNEGKPYERKPYDGERKPYNRDGKPYERKPYESTGERPAPRKKGNYFSTFLGNSGNSGNNGSGNGGEKQ